MSKNEVFTRLSADGGKCVTVYDDGPAAYPFNATFYRREFGMWVEAGYGRYCTTLAESEQYADTVLA